MTQASYLEHFPMEKLSLALHTIPLTFLFLGFVDFFFSKIINNWITTFINYYVSRSSSTSNQYNSKFSSSFKATHSKKNQDFEETPEEQVDYGSLSRKEVEMVMNNLGLFHQHEDIKHKERFSLDGFSQVFDEKEPSLDEVKEAFDVFDDNKDGFIDAMELQRVVRALGLNQSSEMENCKCMISVFDENGDERIDFQEFVKLMDNSFD